MTRYTATLAHHSISSSPIYVLGAKTIEAAKREASMLLGNGFLDHEIVIFEGDDVVASRLIKSRIWKDR